jgi:YD repeat-containing protein
MKLQITKTLMMLATISTLFLSSCKDEEVPPETAKLDCQTTQTYTNGTGYSYTYNAEGQIIATEKHDGETTNLTYDNGLLTGWTSSTNATTTFVYEAGATFPSSSKSYNSDGVLIGTRVYTSTNGYITSEESLDTNSKTLSKYSMEYDSDFNLTKWSADLAMGPPGTPVSKDAMVITNIVTDGKANPYTKNKAMSLITRGGLVVVNGSSNLVSGDFSMLGGDPLPCSSQITYDENDNVISNDYTQSSQTLNFTYTYSCK